MAKHTVLFLVFSCVTLFAGGCARKELVQTDQPLSMVTAAGMTQPETAKTASLGIETPNVEPARASDTVKAADQEQSAGVALQSIPDAGKLGDELERIHFDFDRYLLSPEARETLVKNAERLKHEQKVKVRIAGHCDERGSDDYNLALSERRAHAAMQYLVGLGVAAERLTVIGYGKEKPLAAGHDEASWAENRRDEFEIPAQ